MDRPIIMQPESVRAIIAGRKTMTRRMAWGREYTSKPKKSVWQAIKPGDRLWVRESCGTGGYFPPGWSYRADGVDYPGESWMPSIHMPRRASRLTLTVTATKVERVQGISEADARAEGMQNLGGGDLADFWWYEHDGLAKAGATARDGFALLWNSLHGDRAWTANPEVVALTFTVERRNIDRQAA